MSDYQQPPLPLYEPREPAAVLDMAGEWHTTTWRGRAFPGNHMTSRHRVIWKARCNRQMPSGRPHYGRPCDRHIEIREVEEIYGDGTSARHEARYGCGLCKAEVDATREDGGDWEPLWDEETG